MAGKIGSSSGSMQFEEIRPKSEWKEDNNSNILRVYLPEFRKDHLKITYVHSLRMLRVTGERQIAYSNKWARFNQTFPVSSNCDVNNIQARFVDSVLIVTLPKSNPTPAAAPLSDSMLPPLSTLAAPLPQANPSSAQAPALPAPEKDQRAKLEAAKDPLKEEIEQDSFLKKMKEQEEEEMGKKKELLKKEEEMRKKELLKKEEEMRKKELLKKEEVSTRVKESSMEDKSKMLSNDADSVREALLERGKKGVYDGGKYSKEKMKKVTEAVKGFAMDVSDDRQRIINIGVSVLIIAAVGAFVYCRYMSSTRNGQM